MIGTQQGQHIGPVDDPASHQFVKDPVEGP